jgi:putative addiction module killer protein
LHEVPYEIGHYLAPDGSDPFQDWLDDLRDARAYVAVLRRVDRMAKENFGDHRFCRDGVWEMRVDAGAGYRVYYAQRDKPMIILLCGGDKRKQQADIDRAVDRWRELLRRPG